MNPGEVSKENALLPFPAQNAFTEDIRQKVAELGLSDYLFLWAGGCRVDQSHESGNSGRYSKRH
jgi:hypothetical protein